MNKKRLLQLAGMIPLYEDFSDAHHYNKKGAHKEKFEGRTIIVTDLYDGDVFGYLGHKRFVVSSPLDRGYGGVGHVDEDEVEISDVDNSFSSKETAFLKRWTLSELNESKQLNEAAKGIPVNVSITENHLKSIVKILKKYFYFETTVDQLLSSKYFIKYAQDDAENLFHEQYGDPEGLINAFDGIDVDKLPGKKVEK